MPAVQAELCRTLERLGATAAVPMLYQLSRNTADMTVHKAAADAERALRELDDATPPADIPVEIDDLKAAGIEPLFLELLADESPSVRVHAADGLGRVESVKAIAPLAQLLLHDAQDYVRRAAAAALGAILCEERTTKDRITPVQRSKAVEALAEALADESMPVQSEAAWSLSFIAPGDAAPPVMERFFLVLEQVVQTKPGPWFLTFPALAGALGAPADRVRMAELLLQPATRWKGPVIEALARMGRPGETDADALLAEALKRKVDPRCEWNLVRALGASASPATAPVLLNCLQSPNQKVREEAAAALARQPQGREQLKAAMAAGDEALVMSAVGVLDQPEDLPFLDELAPRLTPKGRIAVQAAAKRLSLNK
jgi:HEAT repeat protein